MTVLAILAVVSIGAGVAMAFFGKESDIDKAEEICDVINQQGEGMMTFEYAQANFTDSLLNYFGDPQNREVFSVINVLIEFSRKTSTLLNDLAELSLGDDWPKQADLLETSVLLDEVGQILESMYSTLERYDGTNREEIAVEAQTQAEEIARFDERLDALSYGLERISEPESCRIAMAGN